MKVVIVGANGAIGTAVKKHIEGKHEVISASKSNSDVSIDITSIESIKNAFEQIGNFDALVVAAGAVAFNSITDITPADWELSFSNKLMGQINLTQIAIDYLNDGGSITLTSGVLSRECVPKGTCATVVNGALEHFVKAAAYEMPKNIRLNIVNPTVLRESVKQYGEFFPGFKPVDSNDVALCYQKSIEGIESGVTYLAF